MNTPKALEQLQQLQRWRNQVAALGLIPPEVGELIKLAEEGGGLEARVREWQAREQTARAAAEAAEATLAGLQEEIRKGERLKADYEALKARLSPAGR